MKLSMIAYEQAIKHMKDETSAPVAELRQARFGEDVG
jgi:hypothetical protein